MKLLPTPIRAMMKDAGRRVRYLFRSKHGAELGYWIKCHAKEGVFSNTHYQKLMLGMAGETNDIFLTDKRVADFGCGPRGTLCWIASTSTKIGIDVLCTQYLHHFGEEMAKHGMLYLASTETTIPIRDQYLDVIFTLNAFDHVANPEVIACELRRILKPGGELIGSFNLNEPKTKAEPQTLTEAWIRKQLLSGYDITRWCITAKPKTGYLYQPLLDNSPIPLEQKAPAILWVRATKL